ncbi:MAG: hypothetical protein HZC55_14865 [Verrucomicrobia bacterium]|nr:hypothetical protein [Verrucomicrobiota bacterium]
MPYWEYKVITSGKGGFATPALLEKFLNDLGRDEWEIIHYQTPPDNLLAFTGLARRSTQRDWTLEDAAAAAAKVEAEKLRAEFEAKFKAASSPSPEVSEERAPSFLEEKTAPDDGLRKLVDTSRDDDPEASEDDKADEWDKLTAAEEDELPSFFEAIRPHMRRNQRGPGMSVGVDYLGKKWDLSEEDLKGALAECGFVMPVDEDSPVEYLEYDGDLYWLNINRRGELWINTKEKPRPVFRSVKGARVEVEAPKADTATPAPEAGTAPAGDTPAEGTEPKAEATPANDDSKTPAAPLPTGPELLAKIRPHMRRNRRGPGGSGSLNFLSRALRTKEAELKAAFVGLGLAVPGSPGDKPAYTEIGNELWWLNLDSRGGLWINGREKKDGETASAAASEGAPAAEAAVAAPAGDIAPAAGSTGETPLPAVAPSLDNATSVAPAPSDAAPAPVGEPVAVAPAPAAEPAAVPAPAADTPAAPAAAPGAPLAAVRLLLKETRTGSLAGKVDRLAADLGRTAEDLIATLVAAGLKVPEKPREKPVFVEHAGEILWFNRNARGELWLNAKASKYPDAEATAAAEDNDSEEGEESAADDDEKKGGRRGGRSRPKKAE